MRPTALCLVQMGKKGLEMVTSYPDVLPTEILNEVTIKSMPMGAKSGDFTSSTIGERNAFSGYVFCIPSDSGRDNIASLVAIYDHSNYKPNIIRKVFSVTINELAKTKSVNTETISNILPGLYKGLDKGRIRIKISSVVSIEIDFEDDTKKEEDSAEKFVDNFTKEIWK